MTPLKPQELSSFINVSRETLDKFQLYVDHLKKWQRKINLVSNSTLEDVWRRHILDSAQLMELLPSYTGNLVDFGSGAGFPALVLAIMGAPNVHMIESDARKSVFLREVARITETPVTVLNKRIETISDIKADVVTARACASLDKLLSYAKPFFHADTQCIFLKGETADQEIKEAQEKWQGKDQIKFEKRGSVSSSTGAIVMVKEIHHVA